MPLGRGPGVITYRPARRIAGAVLAAIALAALSWIALAYLHPDLRRAIVFSGFGLC